MRNNIPINPEIPKEIMDKWQRIVNIMAKIVGVPAGLIMKVDPPQIEVFISSQTEKNPYHKGEKANLNTGLYCETVMQKRESLLVSDATKDPNWDHNPDIPLGMIYYLGFPIQWPSGEIFGTICVLDYKDNPKAIAYKDLIKEFKTVIETDLDHILKKHELEQEKERLKESERKYSLLFNRMLSGFALHEIILDKDEIPCDFRFLDINPEFETILGVKRKEIIGKTVLEVFPKTEKYWIETYGKVALEDIPVRFSQYSSEFDKYFDVSAFSPEKGKFATLFMDITEKKKTEDALKQSEKKYRELVENANSIILKYDKYGNILSMNEFGLKFFGYKEEELLGKNFIGLITPVIESTGRHLDDLLLEVFSNVKKYPQNINEHIKKNGERVWVLWTNRPIKDENDNLIGLFSVGTDITDRKKAEDDIKRLNETLSILNKILRHDIANNLTVTSMALQLMETKDEVLKDKAERSIAKSVDLIERIRGLEFAASNEKTTGNFDVKKVIEGIIKTYPETIFNIKGSGTVIADEALEPVFDNIIRNAIVHGKTDRIDISTTCTDEICEVRITDYGKGIPDEIKGRIFEEGFSYGDSRSTGLGLYIVKNILEKYGGEIIVEDNKPSGAIFILRLKKA